VKIEKKSGKVSAKANFAAVNFEWRTCDEVWSMNARN
jgi:hypothetical protein